MRTFETWATRDTANGKMEYVKYSHPLCDYSWAKYMLWKQIIDGQYRNGDNRQKWMPFDELMQSFVRHTEIVKLLYYWHTVYEERDGDAVHIHVDPIEVWDDWEQKTFESELNACRFNSEAMKLQVLTNNIVK
jgi:hypothetical protein